MFWMIYKIFKIVKFGISKKEYFTEEIIYCMDHKDLEKPVL